MARILSKTGGRAASLRHIPPKLALCVGEPSASAPKNWVWRELTTIARLESGHTPSRKHSEYWGGSLPWISIKDAKAHHGSVVEDTVEKTNQLGIENSSARLLPKNTVCLSRTASVGYVVRMGAEMATSQDFVNWVCGPELLPEFLQQLFLSEGKDILRFASGAVHQTIYYPEAKGFWVCLPPLSDQERIVGILDEAFEGIATATAHAERNLQNARELFQSVLQSTFQQKGDDWVETTLGETLETQPRNGWSPPAANHSDSGIPVLTLSSVTGFIFRPGKIKHTSAETDPSRHYWVRNGDFLITRSNTPELVGHVAIAESIDTPTIYPDLIMRMVPSPDKAVTKFLYWQLRTVTLREIIKGRASGANPTMKKINKAAVQTLPVSLPPLKTQKAIVKKLDALSTETRRLEALYQRKLTALAELKQSLLQRAFAGEL